jgi:hypothetical protein
MSMSMAERWAADEELEGRHVVVKDPRWVEDGLEGSYGPDAPDQAPIDPADIDPPKPKAKSS